MFHTEDKLDYVSLTLLLFNVDHAFSEDGVVHKTVVGQDFNFVTVDIPTSFLGQ
jgi:hypothetical protein